MCSVAAEEREELVLATASRIDRWLLVEAPGPWAAETLPPVRGLPPDVLPKLQARAKAAGARTLLIRRPGGRDRRDAAGRRLFAADSRPGHERLITRMVSEHELLDLPMPFDDAAGWSDADAVVGVCTHGRHDVCCAVRGRPVAAALAASYPDITWEISHIGGDRFAANLLLLPGGHYLGRVTPAGAAGIVDAVLAGRRPDGHYRGRSGWPAPVQAAVELVAQQRDLIGLEALQPSRLQRVSDDRWQVTLTGEIEPTTVVVERRLGPPARLTCEAEQLRPVPSWRLLA